MISWFTLVPWLFFFVFSLLTVGLLITFLGERQWKAAMKIMLIYVLLSVIFVFLIQVNSASSPWTVNSPLLLGLVLIVLLIIPKSNKVSLRIVGDQPRVDERDTIFARFNRLQPGTREYDTYYKQHPEKKEIDEAIRALPGFGEPGSKTYHQLTTLFQVSLFDVISKSTRDLEWRAEPVTGKKAEVSPSEFTRRIKGFAGYLGADLVGITRLNPAYVYSHIGRAPGEWGAPIRIDHPHAIAIAVKMNSHMISHSPGSPATTESAHSYFNAAKVAMVIARYINMLGYEARAHVDGNYRVMCVPIAADAGLGELGRLGLLMTPQYGPRVRLSVVTTDLPLIYDSPIVFGVQHFCSFCKKCATNCPAAALDSGEKKICAGTEKWLTQPEKCYKFWRLQGTDCAVCIKTCPYSHPDTPMHTLLRPLVRRNNMMRRLMFWGDSFFYGHQRQTSLPLPDWHKIS